MPATHLAPALQHTASSRQVTSLALTAVLLVSCNHFSPPQRFSQAVPSVVTAPAAAPAPSAAPTLVPQTQSTQVPQTTAAKPSYMSVQPPPPPQGFPKTLELEVTSSIPERLSGPLSRDSIDARRWPASNFSTKTLSVDVPQAPEPLRKAWIEFMLSVHASVHPHWSGDFLTSLNKQNAPPELRDRRLGVAVYFSVIPPHGELASVAIERSSGVAAFDMAALEALVLAFPVPVSSELASLDGRVHFHWEFFANPDYGCSTYFSQSLTLQSSTP